MIVNFKFSCLIAFIVFSFLFNHTQPIIFSFIQALPSFFLLIFVIDQLLLYFSQSNLCPLVQVHLAFLRAFEIFFFNSKLIFLFFVPVIPYISIVI